MTEVRLSSLARRDLAEIILYMIEAGDSRAGTFSDGLEIRLDEIADRPLTFAPRDDFAKGLRAAPFSSYLIVFRVMPDHIKIARIIHQSRDLRGAFN